MSSCDVCNTVIEDNATSFSAAQINTALHVYTSPPRNASAAATQEVCDSEKTPTASPLTPRCKSQQKGGFYEQL